MKHKNVRRWVETTESISLFFADVFLAWMDQMQRFLLLLLLRRNEDSLHKKRPKGDEPSSLIMNKNTSSVSSKKNHLLLRGSARVYANKCDDLRKTFFFVSAHTQLASGGGNVKTALIFILVSSPCTHLVPVVGRYGVQCIHAAADEQHTKWFYTSSGGRSDTMPR